VLFAEPVMDGVPTDWDFIQPNAANITAVSANVNDKIDHFRHLALQPTTSDSGRLTGDASRDRCGQGPFGDRDLGQMV
jgi:hypothetical protein